MLRKHRRSLPQRLGFKQSLTIAFGFGHHFLQRQYGKEFWTGCWRFFWLMSPTAHFSRQSQDTQRILVGWICWKTPQCVMGEDIVADRCGLKTPSNWTTITFPHWSLVQWKLEKDQSLVEEYTNTINECLDKGYGDPAEKPAINPNK